MQIPVYEDPCNCCLLRYALSPMLPGWRILKIDKSFLHATSISPRNNTSFQMVEKDIGKVYFTPSGTTKSLHSKNIHAWLSIRVMWRIILQWVAGTWQGQVAIVDLLLCRHQEQIWELCNFSEFEKSFARSTRLSIAFWNEPHAAGFHGYLPFIEPTAFVAITLYHSIFQRCT